MTKFFSGIASALVVGAIGWLFTSVLDLLARVDHIDWWLKYKGLLP